LYFDGNVASLSVEDLSTVHDAYVNLHVAFPSTHCVSKICQDHNSHTLHVTKVGLATIFSTVYMHPHLQRIHDTMQDIILSDK